jgi:hypothetical protein
MFAKGSPTSHNPLKISAQETQLKVFLMLIYITTQLRCRLKMVQMPKKMASQPPKVNIPS